MKRIGYFLLLISLTLWIIAISSLIGTFLCVMADVFYGIAQQVFFNTMPGQEQRLWSDVNNNYIYRTIYGFYVNSLYISEYEYEL